MKGLPWAAIIVFAWVAGIGAIALYLMVQIITGFLVR